MSQNCECTKPSLEIPVRGLKIALDEEALSGLGNNCNCVSYSLEEQWTGKYWVDGKKIYQKTMKHLDLPKNETVGIPHGIPNIKAVINYEAVSTNLIDGGGVPIPHISANSVAPYAPIGIYWTNTEVIIKAHEAARPGTVFITLFYICIDR